MSYVLDQHKLDLRKTQSFILDLVSTISINPDAYKYLLEKYNSTWKDQKDLKDGETDSVDSQDGLNMIADLYGAHMSENSKSPVTSSNQTTQSAIERARSGIVFPRIDLDSCNGCRLCVTQCPHKAITPFSHKNVRKFKVDIAKCTNCGKCLSGVCPKSAIIR